MAQANFEKIFRGDGDDEDGPICQVCGEILEAWEEHERDGARVCNRHDALWEEG